MAKSPLHDNPRSQTEADRADEAKGEKDMEERESNDRTAEREGMEKRDEREAKDRRDESEGESKAMDRTKKASDKFIEAMKGLHKQHETERRDYHGNHREALRQMASRHEKAFRDLVEGFKMDDDEGEEVTGTEAAAAADTVMREDEGTEA